jgi:hypothetical protein
MKTVFAAALCAILFLASAVAKERHCTLRVHAEANANDGVVFSTTIRSPFSGKNVVIEKTPSLSERDVVAFRPYPAADGSLGVLLQLDDHGKLALDTLSIERRGSFLFIFLNGRPLTELQVDRRVSDGKIYLPSGLNSSDVELMRKDWRLIGERKK